MVTLELGPVGSGKSYWCMAEAVERCRWVSNNTVVANFAVSGWSRKDRRRGSDGNWFYVPDEELTPFALVKIAVERGFLFKEGSAVLYIDEASVHFNSREWQKGDRKGWLKFFALSRKLGYDVKLIAQTKAQIDKQIREACEFHVKHVCLNRNKWFKWIPVKIFLSVAYWQAGDFKGQVTTRLFSKKVAKMYDTAKIFDPELQAFIVELQSRVAGGQSDGSGAADAADASPAVEVWEAKPLGGGVVGGSSESS